jgi:alpha-galactosidase
LYHQRNYKKTRFLERINLMNRRNFLTTTGISLASVILSDSIAALSDQKERQLIKLPDEVSAVVNDQMVKLKNSKRKELWTFQEVMVNLKKSASGLVVVLEAPKVRLSSITLTWKTPVQMSSSFLNDQWERTYGDVSWHKPVETEILPWYFIEYNGKNTNGFGVKTGARSFCFWQINENVLHLTLDVRSGGRGVQLGERSLEAAEIVAFRSAPGESSFLAARRFAKLMCGQAIMLKAPVYGINDWYFSYGNNSEKLILQHTEMMAPMADEISNRPFSVIDAGWFQNPPQIPNDCCWGDNMDKPDDKFSDMGQLAEKIRKIGMRPGIWTRPLCGSYKDPKSLMLPLIKGREDNKPVLDPSIPENLERIRKYFSLYNEWSYELVKFDFTSFDIFGKWGFEMLKDGSLSESNWSMNDISRTNAEIVLDLYKTIREAAGKTCLLGCNTFSHLSAGLFELNRIGDDTSGHEWARTRKMGVNTLAFRGIQHDIFYAVDADCVGLTPDVPWIKNKQWMQLVAQSGTPLFISAQPEATGKEQKETIRECFKLASRSLPLGEPLDWMETAFPEKWKLNGEIVNFDWD